MCDIIHYLKTPRSEVVYGRMFALKIRFLEKYRAIWKLYMCHRRLIFPCNSYGIKSVSS